MERSPKVADKNFFRLPENFANLSDSELLELSKQIHAKVVDKAQQSYAVKVFGSSIIGEAYGREAFSIASSVFVELSDKGQLHCYKRWCRICKMVKFEGKDDFVSHVVKLPFSKVKKLAELIPFTWRWSKPQSDWAKSHGEASGVFRRLVESKSRPVWYAVIESEEKDMKLLGAKSPKTKSSSSTLSANILNKIFMTAITGKSFEESGFPKEYREDYEIIVQQIKEAPAGTMMSPIWDWAEDVSNGLVDLVLEGVERVRKSQNYETNVGKFTLTDADSDKSRRVESKDNEIE